MEDDQSYIIKKRDLADIIRNPQDGALEEMMKDPMAVMAAAVNDLILHPTVFASTAIRIAHATLKGKMFQQFASEIKDLREKGKLPEDLSKNKNGYQTWVDLLKIIDDEAPDEDRLEALKAAFYAANKISGSDAERIVAYEVFQITKTLKSNEIMVLRAYLSVSKDKELRQQMTYDNFNKTLAQALGHNQIQLVNSAVRSLNEKYLIENHVMTSLGRLLCETIHTYRVDTEREKP